MSHCADQEAQSSSAPPTVRKNTLTGLAGLMQQAADLPRCAGHLAPAVPVTERIDR
jgi:hypothetical protein